MSYFVTDWVLDGILSNFTKENEPVDEREEKVSEINEDEGRVSETVEYEGKVTEKINFLSDNVYKEGLMEAVGRMVLLGGGCDTEVVI